MVWWFGGELLDGWGGMRGRRPGVGLRVDVLGVIWLGVWLFLGWLGASVSRVSAGQFVAVGV